MSCKITLTIVQPGGEEVGTHEWILDDEYDANCLYNVTRDQLDYVTALLSQISKLKEG